VDVEPWNRTLENEEEEEEEEEDDICKYKFTRILLSDFLGLARIY
jgi:hypothetical protein